MGTLFSIDAEVKTIIQAGLDDLITELGKDCTLVYPATKWTSCPNCVYDPMEDKSANRYRDGGPVPFADGTICPHCNGIGRITTETTEVISLLCELDPRKFVVQVPTQSPRRPAGTLQTKGFLSDWPKVERCDHLLYQNALLGLGLKRFKLASDPIDKSNIIQNRYFVCLWERM